MRVDPWSARHSAGFGLTDGSPRPASAATKVSPDLEALSSGSAVGIPGGDHGEKAIEDLSDAPVREREMAFGRAQAGLGARNVRR